MQARPVRCWAAQHVMKPRWASRAAGTRWTAHQLPSFSKPAVPAVYSHTAEITSSALHRQASRRTKAVTCFAFACQGIYIGDITDAHSLTRPMRGAKALVILTSSYPLKDPNGTWYFPEGNYPIDIDWKGSNNQARECVSARAAQAELGICRSVRARSMQGAALLAAAPPASAASAPWQPAHAAQPRCLCTASHPHAVQPVELLLACLPRCTPPMM